MNSIWNGIPQWKINFVIAGINVVYAVRCTIIDLLTCHYVCNCVPFLITQTQSHILLFILSANCKKSKHNGNVGLPDRFNIRTGAKIICFGHIPIPEADLFRQMGQNRTPCLLLQITNSQIEIKFKAWHNVSCIKDVEISGACSVWGRRDMREKNFGFKARKEKTTRKTRAQIENNIKIDLKETGIWGCELNLFGLG